MSCIATVIFLPMPGHLHLNKQKENKWPLRLSVRTAGFHLAKTGSTPVEATRSSDGEMDIISVFETEVPGSSPGWKARIL